MIRALLRKEIRESASLLLAFLGLALLLEAILRLSGGLHGFDAGDMIKARPFLFVLALPSLFMLFQANHLVAGEKERGTLQALLDLPVSPLAVGAIKFAFGALFALFFLLLMRLCVPGHVALPHDAMPISLFLLMLYCCAFFAACLVRNAFVGVMLSVVFAMVSLLGAALLSVASLLPTYLVLQLWVDFTPDMNLFFQIMWFIVLFFIIEAGIAFHTLHHRPGKRLAAIAALPACLIFLPLLWLASICVYNTLGAPEFKPRFETAFLQDEANRESYAEFIRRTNEWEKEVISPRRAALDKVEGLLITDSAWRTPEMRSVIEETRSAREEALVFLGSANLACHIETPYDTLPRLYSVLTFVRLEAADALLTFHRGGKEAALGRMERLLKSVERLTESGTLIQSMVARSGIDICLDALSEMYRLDAGTLPREETERIHGILAGIDAGMPERTARVFQMAGADLDLFAEEYHITASPDPKRARWLLPLFVSYTRWRQDIHDEFFRLMELARADFWTIGAEIDRDPWQDQTLTDRLLRPVEIFWRDRFISGLSGIMENTAEARRRIRLARIRMLLHDHQESHGVLPASLDELFARTGAAPLVDPVSGREFSFPEILAGDR
jgi:ABC-type transport system involved in multi-copper enzyme maturation permease subunit